MKKSTLESLQNRLANMIACQMTIAQLFNPGDKYKEDFRGIDAAIKYEIACLHIEVGKAMGGRQWKPRKI